MERTKNPGETPVISIFTSTERHGFHSEYSEVDELHRRLRHVTKAEGRASATHLATLHELAAAQLAACDYPGAARSFSQMLLPAQLQDDRSAEMNALQGLGRALQFDGRYREALPPLQRALSMAEQAAGEEHLLWQCHAAIGACYQSAEDFEMAEQHLDKALAICRCMSKQDTESLGVCINNLALLYEDQERHREATPLLKQSIALAEQHSPQDKTAIVLRLAALALNLLALDELDTAEHHARRALAIAERHLGGNHVDTGTAVNNLALVLNQKGDAAGAEPLYRRAVQIAENNLHAGHPQIAISLANLGQFLSAQDRDEEALLYLERALAMERALHGESSVGIAICSGEIGLIQLSADRPAIAEPYLRAACDYYGTTKPCSWEHSNCLRRLADCLEMQGRYLEALPLRTARVEVVETLQEAGETWGARARRELAVCQRDSGLLAGALAEFRRVLATFADHSGEIEDWMGWSWVGCARTLAALGREGEARQLLQEAVRRTRGTGSAESELQAELAEELGKLNGAQRKRQSKSAA